MPSQFLNLRVLRLQGDNAPICTFSVPVDRSEQGALGNTKLPTWTRGLWPTLLATEI